MGPKHRGKALHSPITGASSLLSSTTLASSGGSIARLDFLFGRSFSEERLRLVSVLFDGMMAFILEKDPTRS
jgi:hypothetical protein